MGLRGAHQKHLQSGLGVAANREGRRGRQRRQVRPAWNAGVSLHSRDTEKGEVERQAASSAWRRRSEEGKAAHGAGLAVTQERGCGGEVLVAGPEERSGLLGVSARVSARVRGLGRGLG